MEAGLDGKEQMWAGPDGKVEGDLQVDFVQGGRLPIKLVHGLEEQVDHPSQVVFERVEAGLLEKEIQLPIKAWLEGEEELSWQVELEGEDCCEREEEGGQNVMAYMVLVWVERQAEQVERQVEQVKMQVERAEKRSGMVEVVDGQEELQEELQ